jgi:hypothetical protein
MQLPLERIYDLLFLKASGSLENQFKCCLESEGNLSPESNQMKIMFEFHVRTYLLQNLTLPRNEVLLAFELRLMYLLRRCSIP